MIGKNFQVRVLDAYYAGEFGIATLLLILEENDVMMSSDRMALENADKATQDAYMEIVFSEELSESEKAEALSNL